MTRACRNIDVDDVDLTVSQLVNLYNDLWQQKHFIAHHCELLWCYSIDGQWAKEFFVYIPIDIYYAQCTHTTTMVSEQ